jgi:AMMECR1 domain-containing protein
MKDIVSGVLDIYFKKMREPKLEELTTSNTALLEEKWCCFVTLYLNGELRWSAGNIKEIHDSLAKELISNTMQALTGDKRFTPLTLNEAEKIQFRIDKISDRQMINFSDIKNIDPVKNGIIAINRNYKKLASILPNMSPKILTWDDLLPVLMNKLEEKDINDTNYIFYKIDTTTQTNY